MTAWLAIVALWLGLALLLLVPAVGAVILVIGFVLAGIRIDQVYSE